MSVGRPWADSELAMLELLAGHGFHAYDIARAIGRPPASVYGRAEKLGIELVKRIKRHPFPATDPSTWDEAQRICAYANVPLDLAQLVVETSHRHNISVKTLRSDSRLRHLFECRAEIACEARKRGYGTPTIGRALNRDHSTVFHALNYAKSCAKLNGSLSVLHPEESKIAA